jgi:hypothetical protein
MNTIYDSARYKLLTGTFDWTAADLMLTAWSGALEFHPEDDTIEEVSAHGPVERGSSMPITVQTVALNGTAQTNGVVIPSVAVGAPISFFTMSDRKPTHGLSELILFIDEAVDLPFIPNGLDMVIQPDWLAQRGWWRP